MMKSNIKVHQQAPSVVKKQRKKNVSPWKTKKAWLFLLFFGLQSSLFFSIITWLVPIASSVGMTLIQAGALLSVMTIVQLFLNLLLSLDETETPEKTNSWTAMMQTGGFIIGGLLPLIIAVAYDLTSDHQYTFMIGDKKEV